MSIERMKRLWVVAGRNDLRTLLDALASLRSVHLVEVAPDDETAAAFSRLTADTVEADRRIARLRHVLDL
ncbi:MAG TPA: hypothetical protein VMX57_00175, partial [Planctomycetota bacterium]|nr:hypothetical protein [Planctomycetota bacterium]